MQKTGNNASAGLGASTSSSQNTPAGSTSGTSGIKLAGVSSQMQQSAAAQTLQQNTIERTIHFNQAQAIVWQIKFIINQISSKKALS